jgi:hypothetical protein
VLYAAPAEAGDVRDVIVDQSSVLQRYEPPLRRPPTLGITLRGGLLACRAELEGVRFVFRGVDSKARRRSIRRCSPALCRPRRPRISSSTSRRPSTDRRVYRDHDYFAAAVVPLGFRRRRVRIIVYGPAFRRRHRGRWRGRANFRERLQPYIDKMVEMRPARLEADPYALLMTDLAGLTITAESSKILDDPGADCSPHHRLQPARTPGPPRQFREPTFRWSSPATPASTTPSALRVDRRPRRHNPPGGAGGRQARPVCPASPGFAAGYDYASVWSTRGRQNDIHAERRRPTSI